jgi:hypothetical protein
MANKPGGGKCAAALPETGIERRIGIMRSRYLLILVGLASLPATASAHPKVWAAILPHAAQAPTQPPAPPCDGDYCALNALQDAWKRDALKREPTPGMNANSVILDRARFQKETNRFGAPDATAVFNYNILGSGICVGAFKNGAFGVHTC